MNKKRKAVRIAASIAAAIAIWLYVDTVRMPSVPMTVKNIPVEFSGENTTLADRGLMLLSGYDTTIDLTLKGPRRQLYKINKDDICIEGYHDPVYSGELEMTGQLHALNYLKWCRGGDFTPTPWAK